MTVPVTPTLCLITHRRRLSPEARTTRDEIDALERWLDEAVDRVEMIQLREPDLEARVLLELARRLAARAKGTRTAVIVNDRADVARAAGADGVHVKGSGPPVDRVRAFGPKGWTVGRSAHGVDEMRRAGVPDYFFFGTVFPTESKGPGTPVQGLDRLREAAAATEVPVLAVGGIDPDRAARCLAAGAAGIAAIGLFLPPGRASGAMGIAAAVDALRKGF